MVICLNVDVTYFCIERRIKSSAECFLCALESENERKSLYTYFSELVMDARAKEKLIESRRFCNHYFFRMLISATNPEGSNGHVINLITQSMMEKLEFQKQNKRRKFFPRTNSVEYLLLRSVQKSWKTEGD